MTSIIGLVLTAGTAIFEPALGVVKRRVGARLGSSAAAGEGTQNLLCAYLAIAVFAGLAANTLWGAWWLDGVVALGIAGGRWWKDAVPGPGSRATAPASQLLATCSAPVQLQMLLPPAPGKTPTGPPQTSCHNSVAEA